MAEEFGLLNDSAVTDYNSSFLHTTNSSPKTNTTLDQYTEYQVAIWLNHYTPWIALIVALLGNGTSVVTVIKMKTLTSVALFVSYLGITDTLYILFSFIYFQLTGHKVKLGDAGCQWLLFLMNYVLLLANWTVALMTIERFVAVYFPLKISRIFNLKTSIIALVGKAIILVIPPSSALWMFTEVWLNDSSTKCRIKPEMEHMEKVISWVDFTVISLFPCLLLIFLNGGIIIKLRKSAKVRQHSCNTHLLRNKGDKTDTDSKTPILSQHTTVSVMLVTISVTFIILQLPITLFYIIIRYRPTPTEGKSGAVFILLQEIVHTLSEFNHAINFLLYFLSGRKFRQQFLKLFPCGQFLRRVRLKGTRENNSLSSRGQTHLNTQLSQLTDHDVSCGN